MSGAETLGVLASATQLAAYSIKIVLHLDEIYAEVRNTPNRTREHLQQVRELIETTTLIERHKSLRSPVIHSHLQTTLLEARSLYNILRELTAKYTGNSIWRYWAILRGVGEQEILTGLGKLEREKSALRLCISIVHTDLLQSIQGSINRFRSIGMSQQSGHTSTTKEVAGNSIQEPAGNNNSKNYRILSGKQEPLPENLQRQPQKDEESQGKPGAATSRPVHRSARSTENVPGPGNTYGIVLSDTSATQLAGNQNGNNPTPVSRMNHYGVVTALGTSLQVAGDMNTDKAIEGFYSSRK